MKTSEEVDVEGGFGCGVLLRVDWTTEIWEEKKKNHGDDSHQQQ
jgi:hypothetical protein